MRSRIPSIRFLIPLGVQAPRTPGRSNSTTGGSYQALCGPANAALIAAAALPSSLRNRCAYIRKVMSGLLCPRRSLMVTISTGLLWACVMTLGFRVDRWTDDGNPILDYVAAVADFVVARAAYRAACRRWPEAKITLRQVARVVERTWSTSEAAS